MYTNERNILILIALLKAHGIKKIIISPGATNVSFVESIQNDEYFELFSCVDERSAAYMACGLSVESGEVVALSCTGATASRNYVPGLTEAYYRKIPILAITSTQPIGRIGHNIPQVIDRSSPMNDIVKMSVHIPVVHSEEDYWLCNTNINKAILELRHNGGGPVHIDIETEYSKLYNVKQVPDERVINRIQTYEEFPLIKYDNIAIFLGSHKRWGKQEINEIETFCEKYNAVVLCDFTSNYCGKYSVHPNIVTSQQQISCELKNIDLLIHIGEISGAYIDVRPRNVWRISQDGEVCDTYRVLTKVFEMPEICFFQHYNACKSGCSNLLLYTQWKNACDKISQKIPELPFSNIAVARKLLKSIKGEVEIHLGILNTLRSWNLFQRPYEYEVYCNTGGFGIDGCISTAVGASLYNSDKIYYCIVGDLAFFYDINSLGNRHITSNVRIIVINNGKGTEFRNYGHTAYQLGDKVDDYIAAAGHFGNKSKNVIKNFTESLGYKYITAENEEELDSGLKIFTSEKMESKPIVFEIFTNSDNESAALKIVYNLEKDQEGVLKSTVKAMLGEQNVKVLKNIMRKK